MDERVLDELQGLREDVRTVMATQARMDETLRAQHGSLRDHMARTEAAEENLDILRTETNARLAPLEQHLSTRRFLWQLVLGVAGSGLFLVAVRLVVSWLTR